MMLTFDGDRVVEAKECGHCARLYSLVRSFVLREGRRMPSGCVFLIGVSFSGIPVMR